MARRMMMLSAALLGAGTAHAACPMELAVYGDHDKAAGIDFFPRGEAAAVTNRFRMVFDKGVMLDGIVMWSEGVERPNGMLTYKCPEGDVTGEELETCTVWQGVIYTGDKSGTIGLLPAERSDAPETLIFSDLAYALRYSSVYGEDGISTLPADVFSLQGCQE
jgi:hypothetical protein